jgi:hypothetical protein
VFTLPIYSVFAYLYKEIKLLYSWRKEGGNIGYGILGKMHGTN